jgi:hypothetical protein
MARLLARESNVNVRTNQEVKRAEGFLLPPFAEAAVEAAISVRLKTRS